MGQQYQMFKTIEKKIEQLEQSGTPSEVFVIVDDEGNMIIATAMTVTRNRTNQIVSSRSLTAQEFEELQPKIEDGSIKALIIIDDMEVTE